ncbi:MAG: glutaredoxin family protein [Dokdonella sp.]
MQIVDLPVRKTTVRETESPWILYQRDDCQLCDEAVAILAHANAPDFKSIWIDDNAALEARYGDRVPVLRDSESGREMEWPFDVQRVSQFLGT